MVAQQEFLELAPPIELAAKGRIYAEKVLPPSYPDLVTEVHELAPEYGPVDHDARLDRVYSEHLEFARRSARRCATSSGEVLPRRRSRPFSSSTGASGGRDGRWRTT